MKNRIRKFITYGAAGFITMILVGFLWNPANTPNSYTWTIILGWLTEVGPKNWSSSWGAGHGYGVVANALPPS